MCTVQTIANQILELFQNACQSYGISLRVRSNHGLENMGVAQMMLECRGVNRSSVHSQRVERL